MHYSKIPYINRMKYLIISFFMYFFFIVGSKKRNKKKNIVSNKRKQLTIRFSEQILYVPVISLGLFFVWLNRAFLFQGYNTTNNRYKGTLSAYVIMLFSITLMNLSSKKKCVRFVKAFCDKWGIGFIFFSLTLLSMGGRLYVLTSIIAVMVFYSNYYTCGEGYSCKSFLRIFSGLILVSGMIGLVRYGNSIDLKDIFFNILAEPLYDSFSLVTYLANNEIKRLFSIPRILLSGFINLFPTLIFPDKVKYIKSVFDFGIKIEAPLGGTHYFTSFMLDFGILGSMAMFYIFGRIIRVLCQEPVTNIKQTMYCLICSYMTFAIYRDAMDISIIKDIIEFSIVIPAVVSLTNRMLYETYMRWQKRKNEENNSLT